MAEPSGAGARSYPDHGPNALLTALPESDRERLLPALEAVWLPVGKVLHEVGEKLTHVYFPATCLASLVCVMEDGASPEVSLIGSEGMIGLAALTGGERVAHRAVVFAEGHAYRLRCEAIHEALGRAGGRRRGALNLVLLRYLQALLTQMAQTAVCNRQHAIPQQLCRWLLFCVDRSGSNELRMTQELIAGLLGVRREGVTEAAGRLQAAGLIQYQRGHITVLDRAGLEARCCECYRVVRKEYERLLPGSFMETV